MAADAKTDAFNIKFLGLEKEMIEEPVGNLTEKEKQERLGKKLLIHALWGEFLITLLFMFAACATGINATRSKAINSPAIVGVSAGFAAVGLIYAFADVSGAHFNPAVTFACFIGGKTSWKKALMYIGAQLVGDLAAMALISLAFPTQIMVGSTQMSVMSFLIVRPSTDAVFIQYFIMEMSLTFIFVYVIFAVAFDTVDSGNPVVKVENDDEEHRLSSVSKQKEKGKHLTIYTTSGNTKAGFAPIAIGFTLGMLTFLGGSVSGGAFNPARVFGPALIAGEWTYVWMYWAADLAGGALAAVVQIFFSHQRLNTGNATGVLGLIQRATKKSTRVVMRGVGRG